MRVEFRYPESQVDSKNIVAAVLKACAILECFSATTPELSLGEVANRTKVNKTTAHRLLKTLELAGWIQASNGGLYRPSMKVWTIGSSVVSRLDLRRESLSSMEELADRFEDTAYLMIPSEGRAVTLDKIVGRHPVRVELADVGRSLPLDLGAGPLAILAYRPDLLPEAIQLGRRDGGPWPSVDSDALLRRLEDIRRHGIAVSHSDLIDGVAAVSAPIFDARGTAVASISLGGLRERFAQPRLDEICRAVRSAGSAISTKLGARDTALPTCATTP